MFSKHTLGRGSIDVKVNPLEHSILNISLMITDVSINKIKLFIHSCTS